jgi:membrane protein involved in colicin uptake
MAEEIRLKQEADLKAAELKAREDADAKAAAELRAKLEAESAAAAAKLIEDAKLQASKLLEEAKLKAEKAANQTSASNQLKGSTAKAVAPKKVTISCTKGKLVKKVSAINPKCPAGYKKR